MSIVDLYLHSVRIANQPFCCPRQTLVFCCWVTVRIEHGWIDPKEAVMNLTKTCDPAHHKRMCMRCLRICYDHFAFLSTNVTLKLTDEKVYVLYRSSSISYVAVPCVFQFQV